MDEETIFSTRHGKTYRKRYAKPKQPNSKAQMAMRLWQRTLPEADREAWRGFAQKQRRVDRVSLTLNRPAAHSVFLRFAVNALRAGFAPPRMPPAAPSPQPIALEIKHKGKGLALRWVPRWSAWPYPSLFRTIGFIPLARGECAYAPALPGKRCTFDGYVITPDGQQSRPFRTFLAL